MSEKNNKKFIEFFKKFFQKIKPRFSFHYVAYTILFTIIVFSVISVVSATTPNPGHPWAEVGDGVFNVTNNQTATRTYTFPDANATVLTTNAAVTVAQGGTGLGTIADKTLLVTTAANTLSALVIPAGQSIRRNAGDTAFEAFTPGSGTVTAVSVATANGISGSSSGGATPSLTLSLGAITPSTVNGLTLTSNATGFSVSGGTTSKSLTVSNSLTLAGTDATVMTFPTTSATIARTDAAQTFTGTQTFSSTISGSVSGSAATLTTTRAINGVNFDGSAAITVPVNNANDVATASAVYPLWTATAGGNFAAKVSTTALSFVPSTGILSATGFSGSGASLTSLTAGNLSGTIPSGVLGNSTHYIGTTAVTLNRASAALVLTGITSIDGSAASATKATNLVGGNSTTLLGSIPYQSNTDTTTLLAPNTTATKKFFRMTGTGTNGAIPAWDTLVDADIPATLTGKSVNGVTLSTSAGATNFLAGDGTYKAASGGSMVYPGSGIPNSTGSAWGTSYSTIGSGTVLALATDPTFTSKITTPSVLGGTTATSPLTLQATSATGASGASINFKVGDNGSLQPLTITNEGRVGINTNSPAAGYALDVNVGSDDARFYGSGGGGLGFVLEDTAAGGHAWYFNTSPVDGAFGISHAGATGSTGLPGSRALTILPNGNVGVGTTMTAPTASLQIEAGTATAGTAPLKLTSGINLGTTEAGAIEYDGTHLYFTAVNAGTRYQLDQQGGSVAANSLDFAQLKDALTLDASTSISFGASTYGLTFTNNGTGNEIHNLSSTGDFVIQDNGTQAFSVLDTGTVQIGIGSGTNTPGLLVLDSKNTTSDPTGVNGATYYNSTDAKFRCYRNGAWENCGAYQDMMLLTAQADPVTPAAGTLNFYAKLVAGRLVPKWKSPSGVDTSFQSSLAFNTINMWTPSLTTTGNGIGTTWAAGTGTFSSIQPTDGMGLQLRRSRFTNIVTTTNQILGITNSTAASMPQFYRGSATGRGGFFFQTRFAIGAIPATTVRLFVGLCSMTTGAAAADTITGDCAGLSHITTDNITTMAFMTRDNTATNRATFTVPTLAAGNTYDFTMYAKPNDTVIYYRLVDLLTGNTIVDSSSSTNLPRNTIFMGPQIQMSNGTANLTVATTAIDINKIYIESDM